MADNIEMDISGEEADKQMGQRKKELIDEDIKKCCR